MKTYAENIAFLLKRLSEKSDERALDELFHIYYDRLLNAAYFVVKSKDISEEVVADVFYRLWQNREKLTEVKNLDNYLFISTRNTALNYLAKEQKVRKDSIDEVPADTFTERNTADELIAATELKEKITASIDSLPPKCREIFKLIRFNGMKYREVAEHLQVSINTVDTQMGIALKKLSDMLDFQGKKR